MEIQKKTVTTVHEKDLDNLFNKLGIKKEFEEGKFKCKFCHTVVTKETIYSVLPESGSFNFICDKPECVGMFMAYIDDKNKIKIKND